jgi:hypothetical protein
MISVVVLMVISSIYFNVITFVIMIQTLTYVCRRINNYFVVLLYTNVSSFLLQMNRRCYCHRYLSLVSLKEGEKSHIGSVSPLRSQHNWGLLHYTTYPFYRPIPQRLCTQLLLFLWRTDGFIHFFPH